MTLVVAGAGALALLHEYYTRRNGDVGLRHDLNSDVSIKIKEGEFLYNYVIHVNNSIRYVIIFIPHNDAILLTCTLRLGTRLKSNACSIQLLRIIRYQIVQCSLLKVVKECISPIFLKTLSNRVKYCSEEEG